MKFIMKILSLITAVALAVSFVVTSASAETLKEISQNSPFNMTVLGDSIAAGYGLEGHERDKEPCYECSSYANILAEKYGLIGGANYFNEAVSGATTADLIVKISDEQTARHITISDTVIISIGGNDLLGVLWYAVSENSDFDKADSFDDVISSLTPQQMLSIATSLKTGADTAIKNFETNFNSIIDTIRQINPNGLVIVQTLYNPFETLDIPDAVKQIVDTNIEKLNETIKNNTVDANGQTRYVVADVASEFANKTGELTNISGMDIHPNADGHLLISELLDKEITSHTFTTWVIDADASSEISENEKKETVLFGRIMFAGFFMLIILMTFVFLHSMNQIKKQ